MTHRVGLRRGATLRGAGAMPVAAVVLLMAAGCGGEPVIDQPRPLYGEEPVEYPLALWDAGVEGETVLRVRVTDTGVIDSIEIATTSGHVGLDSAAISGVRELRFDPGRQDGERTRMGATLPVVFSKRPGGAGATGAPPTDAAGEPSGERSEPPPGPENE
jgi:TonB family protein